MLSTVSVDEFVCEFLMKFNSESVTFRYLFFGLQRDLPS